MFVTHSLPSTPYRQTGHYTPARPSPLGPRSSNIATPPWSMGSPSSAGEPQKPSVDENAFSPVQFPTFSIHADQFQNQGQSGEKQQSPSIFGGASTPFLFPTQQSPALMSPTSPSPSSRPKYADRYSSQIANPMKNTTSLARSKTRKMFLNRVKNERDTGRFEARGEQMMMAEHLADKRQWEESMARDADAMMQGFEYEEDDMLPEQEADVQALDEFVTEEEAMEMALQETAVSQPAQNASFSDEDYDDIFMTLPDPAQSQDMDMS
ncbi:hypothetical protein N7532_004006 [Penicillium argentinense]|uniref:Uncharacterized protein n=1 Tax=Penicillium argentinense TaxID=1131581 RepID=A0A9W9FP22_9EURO|nr:uncharacterized protein N7532_004006 [Penicillium argentinense]KAJ5103477.1 hypothetical protein N7532_004006 [Penicillium argentinense]